MYRKYWLLLLCVLCSNSIWAQYSQDTLRLNLYDAEGLFAKNNIQLLAQKYSIDSAKANLITAKLYDNPNFDFSSGFYNQTSKKFFDYSNDNREISLQLSQLIKTAGKRTKNIALAKTGVTITEYEFSNLLRSLQYTLRNDFYNIYYLQKTQQAYFIEINSLQQTVAAFTDQVKKGNIAAKDLLRMQSQLYTLQAELATLQNTIDDIQSEFKLLLRAKSMAYIIPVLDQKQNIKTSSILNTSYQSLIDSAYQNRHDLKVANTNITFNQQNLALQKALAVPDLTFNVGYDRLGSYVQNYNSIGFGFPIPIFNRNQGNIKQAKIGIQSSKIELQGLQDVIESQIANAYIGAVRAEHLLQSFDPKFEEDFNSLISEVSKNFEKRNISILEFIDFYDSYKQNVVQLNTLRYNLTSQLEQLNFTTGTRIFNK
jgi:outer membrane protein, heavy metal efflux system